MCAIDLIFSEILLKEEEYSLNDVPREFPSPRSLDNFILSNFRSSTSLVIFESRVSNLEFSTS